MTFLAGDLGGTKTLLALFSRDGTVLHRRRLASADYPTCEALLEDFLTGLQPAPKPQCFVLGVAGPVLTEGPRTVCDITNLRYRVDAQVLQARLGCPVSLVNDFYAAAGAVAVLAQGDTFSGLSLAPLRPVGSSTAQPGAPLAVLGAGTGLGEACVLMHQGATVILPSEGGHTDFAPGDEVEVRLHRYLSRRYPDHVSWERVLSGAGIVTLYEFFRDELHVPEEPVVAQQLGQHPDGAEVISHHALAGSCALCSMALSRFVLLLGAEAGNLALKTLSRGGVFLAGGIAAKNLPFFQNRAFRERFARKGRFEQLLNTFPLHVVVGEDLGLCGAATLAQKQLGEAAFAAVV